MFKAPGPLVESSRLIANDLRDERSGLAPVRHVIDRQIPAAPFAPAALLRDRRAVLAIERGPARQAPRTA